MRWRADPVEDWHHWFAWFPVHAGEHWVWLEPVERKWGLEAAYTHGDSYEVPIGGYYYRLPA